MGFLRTIPVPLYPTMRFKSALPCSTYLGRLRISIMSSATITKTSQLHQIAFQDIGCTMEVLPNGEDQYS